MKYYYTFDGKCTSQIVAKISISEKSEKMICRNCSHIYLVCA